MKQFSWTDTVLFAILERSLKLGGRILRYQTILFDLDGTLTDPGLGITNSIQYAMEQIGMEKPPREELYQFIGPPLLEEFQKVYGVDRAVSEEMLRHFRVYFEEKGLYENQLYEGVLDMLSRLKESACQLVLATSKPEPFADMILHHFGMRPFFSTVAGSTLDETRTDKAAVIAYALDKAGITDRSRCIMVGDREHDVFGARANGLPSLGVLYGYGSRQELQKAGALFFAETVKEIPELLLFRRP